MYKFRRARGPGLAVQRQALSFRRDVDRCQRWEVFFESSASSSSAPVYELWLAGGAGNLFHAGTARLALPCVREGRWDVRISDPSARLEREVAALQRAWDAREDG